MTESASKKYVIVALLALCLWASTSFIFSISEERRGRREEVLKQISSSLTPNQKIGTPYISVKRFEVSRADNTTNTSGTSNFNPATVIFSGHAKVDSRSRGIFKAQAYNLDWKGKAEFDLPPEKETFQSNEYYKSVKALEPVIVIPLSAHRALQSFPRVRILSSGNILKPRPCGTEICYDTGLTYEQSREALRSIEIEMKVAGIDQVSFTSGASSAQFTLTSDWANPGFSGTYLPSSRTLSKDGFEAKWNIVKVEGSEDSAFSLRFMENMDVYTLTDRATKYSILFILCVFGGFVLVEVSSNTRLHPLQYALVGAALVIFYLLVLSLSEHINFLLAYSLSAMASTTLIGVYLSAAMKNRRQSIIFSGALLALYATLFVILSAEDFALLFGSGLIFALLTALMMATRKTDWYQYELPQDKSTKLKI